MTRSYEKENQDKESHGHLLRWLHRGVAAPNVMVSVIRTERPLAYAGFLNVKVEGSSVNNVPNYVTINGNVIQIGHELFEGTFVNRFRKVICSETMA